MYGGVVGAEAVSRSARTRDPYQVQYAFSRINMYVSTNLQTVTNLQTGRPVCRFNDVYRHSVD